MVSPVSNAPFEYPPIGISQVRIITNKNTIPFDPESPFITSGIRIGTPAVTTRGMKEAEMEEIAEIFALTLDEKNSREEIKENEI